MTQREIDTMDVIVNKMSEGAKLSQALKEVYTQRHVLVPYDPDNFNISLMDLKMSRRSTNALLRAGLRTLGDVVNYCSKRKITDIANLGQNSGVEIFEVILDYCWQHMSATERKDFLIDTVERNSIYARI